jgi:hypothetical protein
MSTLPRMSDFEQGGMHPIWVDVVEAVRTLLGTFGSDTGTIEDLRHSESLVEGHAKLESHGRRPTTYALVAFAGATIRWAAFQLDRDESDVLAEIGRGVGVES